MNMTREEAVANLEKMISLFEIASEQNKMIDYTEIIETFKFCCDVLQPVTQDKVKQIHSRWITVVETNGKEYSKCANCQMELDRLEDAYSFCPYCGAKMDGKDINVPTKSGMEEEDDG